MKKKEKDHGFAMILEHTKNDNISEVAAMPMSSDMHDYWEHQVNEGKLAVDVAQDDKYVFVVSPMGGSKPDKIEVFVHNDLLTIRGIRENPLGQDEDIEYYYKECFWGTFSRSIILPVDVKGDLARAQYQNGILHVSIPKAYNDRKVPIEIIED